MGLFDKIFNKKNTAEKNEMAPGVTNAMSPETTSASTHETDQEIVKRLSEPAGRVAMMLKQFFTTDKGLDITWPMLYAAGLTGRACHEAAKANHEEMVQVQTKIGKNYYFGDSINHYLLENQTSLFSFVRACTDMPEEEMIALVEDITQKVGTEDLMIWKMTPDYVYKEIDNCWKGIFNNMTNNFCQSPSEWPILFSITAQIIMVEAMGVGAPKEDIRNKVMQCAIIISKMDEDSL